MQRGLVPARPTHQHDSIRWLRAFRMKSCLLLRAMLMLAVQKTAKLVLASRLEPVLRANSLDARRHHTFFSKSRALM